MSCGTKVIESTDIKTSIYYSASSMSISFLIQNVLSFWLTEISGGEGGIVSESSPDISASCAQNETSSKT